ncbi:sensor histidine kinase [[Clostridium] scindens]|uniref:sensor histidine kinase n=1 Tax=Clostridium scindens (strain JCM 10418 / VPI 12708) TaxID=29347 RepID=UPI003AF1A88D
MAGIAGIIILLLDVVILVLARDGRNKKKEMEVLLQRLDDALEGGEGAYAYDESMDSAIADRLNKLLRSSSMGKERAYQDRDRIKSLISDISHQIRTPLSNIMLYTGLLQEKKLDGQSRMLADQIQGQAEKLDFFMKELIRSSYMETDMIVVSPRTAPVGELVDRACQAVEAEALKKGILIRQPETDRIICKFDMKWTLEAVRNILENALKYSPEGSEVQIEIAPNEAFTCISIQDEGIGIREEEQGLVFERFYRSRDVKKEPGMGIGLYLAREIISRQGGYIEARSEYAKGTCFCIYLPNF